MSRVLERQERETRERRCRRAEGKSVQRELDQQIVIEWLCLMKKTKVAAVVHNVMLLGFWEFFSSKSLQLLYECWHMVHLLIRWMRLPGWGSPLLWRAW
ncbi:unnamed protein product [Prunus brigantina]